MQYDFFFANIMVVEPGGCGVNFSLLNNMVFTKATRANPILHCRSSWCFFSGSGVPSAGTGISVFFGLNGVVPRLCISGGDHFILGHMC